MILRMLALAGGLTGAAATAQFPEFSQQYVQRLGGAVDALGQVVADFDASARAEGLTREAALGQMVGADFVERRRKDMERTFARHERLTDDLQTLSRASPYQRAQNLLRFTDTELIGATRAAFVPAVPISVEGAVFAGGGFVLGWGAVALLLGFLLMPLRRRRRREPVWADHAAEPPLSRPAPATLTAGPNRNHPDGMS